MHKIEIRGMKKEEPLNYHVTTMKTFHLEVDIIT